MASNRVQGEALRAWQLALRSNRKQPDFFQVGGKPVGAKTEEGPLPKKEMKQKRGRPPRRGGSAGQPLAVSSQVSPSCSPVSPPSKQGGKKSKPELMVIEEGDDIPVEHEPLFGRVVWAQFGSFRSYHPALVIKGSLVNLATPDSTQAFVFWFSDRKVSAVPREKLLDFVPFFKERAVHCHGKQGQQGILKAIEELQRQAESSGHRLMDMDPLHWAHTGFPTRDNADLRMFRPGPDFHFPESILERLADIGAEIREKASMKDRDIPNEFHDESAITAVWQGTKNISDVCIGCGDWDRKILCPHPLFKGGLCCKCKDSLQETFYAVGDDGTHSFCAVCGAGGQLFVCDTPSCGRVFCVPCVEELGGEDVLKKVQEARTWPCFLCQPFQSSSHGLLTPLPDWRENLVLFFDMGHRTSMVPDLDYFKTRRPIRVLSLFDGIGTGLLALKRAGFQVEVYYASETDGQATIICQANHSQAVTQLGDVTKITTDMLAEIVPIDLLMGGSPCNELSLANPLRKGFDVEGSGVLFFDFYRVLRDLQALNGSTHLFWLYENVASMRCAYRAVISRFLQCQPAVWDAKHLSAQKRSRFFWGNIPGLYSTPEVSEALRQEVDLNSVLTRQCGRQANVQRVRTVTTQSNSLLQGPQHSTLPVTMAGSLHTLWLSELERLFGFPTHYTDVGNLPPTKRRALLGRSWSVQVITEILRPLSQYFATASNDDSHRGSTSTREANSDTVVTDSTATHIETFVTNNCDTSECDWTATHVAASLTNNSDTRETDQTATAITETDQTATAITETDQTATAVTTSAANHSDTNSDNISTRVATSMSRDSDNADSGIATGAMATTTTPDVHMIPGERITAISAVPSVTTVSYSDTTNTTSAFSCSDTVNTVPVVTTVSYSDTTNTASAINYSDTTNTVPVVTTVSYSDTTNTVPAFSAISYSDTKNNVPAVSTVSYSDTTNTASAINYSDTTNTKNTTNTASAVFAISYSDTKNTVPAISTVSYSDTTNASTISFIDTTNTVSIVSFSDTTNVSTVSYSDTTNSVPAVSYSDTKNIISTVRYSDTTNTIPAISYSSTHSDTGELNPARADKSTHSSTRSDKSELNPARADKPTGSSTRSDACELNSTLADKPTRRFTRTSAVKGRCALTDDVEHSSVPTDRTDRSSPVAGPLTRSCTRIDTVERSASVAGKTPKHSFTFTGTVKRGTTRRVALSKRRSGCTGITEHSNPITSRVRCSSCHTEPSKSSSRATAVKSSSPATAVEASCRATAVKSSPDAGAVRCSAHASAVTSRSDTNAVKSDSDINAVRSNSDVNAVKSRSDSNALKSRSDTNVVKSSSDANTVESRSDVNTVESRSDVNTVESNSDANAVKSSSDANAVTSGSDANAVKSSSDANAVESSFDTYTVVSSSDTNAVKSSSDASGVQCSSDTTAVKSSSDANAVKSSSDANAVKSSSDANSAKSSPDACTVKCRSRANAARFSSSRAITGRTRRRAADTSKIRRGAADTSNPPDRQNNDPVSTVIDEPTTTSDSQTGEGTAVGYSANTMGDVTADSSTLFAFISATGHSNSGNSPVSGARESEVLPTGVSSDECRGLSGRAAADPPSAVRAENVHQPVLIPVGIEGSIPVEASGQCPSEDLGKGFDVFQLSNIDLDVEPGFDNEEEHDEEPDKYKCVERFVDSIAHLPDNHELPCSNEDVVSATDQEEVSALEEIISAGSTAADDQSYLTTSDIEEKLLCSSDDDDHFVAVGILTRALRPRPSSSPPPSVTAMEALTPHETTTTTTTIDSERQGPAQDVLEAQGNGTASGEGRTSVTGSRVSDQGDASQRHHNPTHDSKRETLISVNKTATGSDDTTDCLATSAAAAERPSLDVEALPTSNRSPREPGLATKQSSSTCPSDGATDTNPCMRLEPRDGYLVLQRYTESKRAEASSLLGSILEAGAGTSGSVSHQLDEPDASAGAGLSARKERGNSGRLEGRQGRCTLSLGDGVTLTVELHDDRQDTQRSGCEVKDAGLCPDGAPGGAGNPATTEVGRETFGESCLTGPAVSTVPDCMRTKARICSEPCQTYSASVQMCPKTRGRTEATTAETATPCSGQKSVEVDVSVLETRVTRAMSRGRADKLQSKRRESCTHSADSRSSCGPSVQRSGRPQTRTVARPKSRTVEMSKSHFTPPGAVSDATYDVEPRRSRGVHMPRDPPICSVATDAEDANETVIVTVDQISMARKVLNVVTGDVSSACAMAFAVDDASSSGISTTRSVNVCAQSSSMNVSQKVTTIDKTKKAETSRKGPFQPENANRSACRTTTRAWCDGRLRHRSSGTEKAKGKAATFPVVDQRERNQQPSDEAPSLRVTSNETAASVSSSPYITPRQEHRDKLRLTGDNANSLASMGGGACCNQVSAQHQSTAGVPSQDRGCKSQSMAENDDFRKRISKTRKTSNANRHSGGHRSWRKRSLSWNVRSPRDRNDPDISRSSSDADQKTSLDNACSQDQNRRLRKRTRLQGPSVNICSTADEDRMDTCPVKAASPVNQAWQRGASTSISSTADGNWIDSCSVKANSLMTQTGQRRASANTADGHEIDRCEVEANCPVAQTWQPRSSTSISSTADKNRNEGCQVKANSPGTQTWHRQKSAREGDHAAQWQEREMRPTQTTPPEDHRQKRCPRKMAPRECPPPGERRLQRKRKAVGGRVPGNQKVRLRAWNSTYTGSGDRSSSQ